LFVLRFAATRSSLVEHEAHAAAVPGQISGTAAEGGDEVVEACEEHVCQNRALDVAPQAFDQVEAR
jgi:hypothetical protein